jgi:hypothetical protein
MLSEVAAPAVYPADAPVKSATKSRRFWYVVASATAALLLAGAHFFQALHAARDLQVEIEIVSPVPFHEETPRVAHLLVQRADGAYNNIEARCYASAFLDQRSTFRFPLPNRVASQFLFSPAFGEALVAIRGVAIRVGNAKEVTRVPLERVEAVQQVEILERKPERVVLKTHGGERVPLLRLDVANLPETQNGIGMLRLWLKTAVLFLVAGGIAFLALQAWPRHQSSSYRAAIPFFAVTVLALCMALLSRFNAHPDEYLHFETARYFVAHLLPPALDDPAAAPSFSHYGVSYLQDLDTSYFLMGKFMAALAWLGTPEIAARLFNVLLFAVVSVYVLMRLRGSLAAAVLLISPQIWYVFSYVNGDAWALAVALVAVVQLATEDSGLNKYLRAGDWRTCAGGGLGFAGVLVLLLMAKRNYYLFLPFIALVAIWKTLVWERSLPRLRLAAKWTAIVLTVLLLYVPARATQAAINRFELSRLRTEQAEKFAAPGYRPSEIAAGKGASRMALRNQGVPFTDLFGKYRWGKTSFQSFCGMYHWMSLPSPGAYYAVMGALYAALLLTIGLAFRKLPWSEVVFGTGVLCTAGAVILLSAYLSWNADFQPQGRYLFPILPMLAFVLYRYRETLPSRALHLLFTGLFAASVFSFVFTGLRAIPQ